MEITFAILVGLFQFHIVAATGQDCNGFKMYDGDKEVTDFTCRLFMTDSCENGPSEFPNNLSVGESVGKPRDFDVREFRRNFTIPDKGVVLTSGVTFTWKPPLDTISRRYTKGFYLKRLRVGSGNILCRLIDLQQVDLTASTEFHFSYEVFPFKGDSFETYLAYLTSLPPPTDLEFEGGLVEQTVFTIQPAVNYSETSVVYPNHWTTWINLKLHGSKGIVEVRFGYPTDDSLAEFIEFTLQIVEKTATTPLDQRVVRKIGSETEGVYNFTNVPNGTYKVQVMPVDQYLNIPDKCQCWKPNANFGYRECDTCRFSVTEHFNFTSVIISTSSSPVVPTSTPPPATSTAPPDVSTPPTTPKTGASTNEEPRGATHNTVIVVVAVVVPAIILILVAMVLVYFYRRGELTKFCKGGTDINKNFPPNGKSSNEPKHMVPIIDAEEELKVPQLSRKNILLLASEDHEYFTQAVERLACFLRLHCMCDVTFAPQQMPQLRKTSNSYCWLSTQIDSADFVVIVTSEAAFRLYRAYQKGNGYTKAALGPEGDMFTPGIQHICGKIANNEDVRNIVMVYFDHTSPSFRLPIAPLPSFLYHLPNHLTKFLHHIHGLDKTKMDLSKVNLPLKGNVEELGGKEWLDAVQLAKDYEQLNPKWFDLKFGKPAELYPSQTKPDYNKQDSEDSGYTESRNSKELKHRLSSASNNAGGIPDDADFGIGNSSFTKDDFLAPSVCTDFTAYTVPFPDDDKPSEIDDRSISEEFYRLNQQYEQELQQHQSCASPVLPSDPHGIQILYANQMERGLDSYAQEDEDHDCISVSSAQSV